MSDISPVPEDLGADYTKNSDAKAKASSVAAMEQFLQSAQSGDPNAVRPQQPVDDKQVRPLPEPKPLRRPSTDPTGRPVAPSSATGTVMRNLAEIPGQARAGVESALEHSMGWAINPLADWLNEHVADLSYKEDAPQTTTGAITKNISEFLTGFIPAMKALKAVGVAGAAAPVVAGAVSSFATQDPSSGRLSDIWNKAGLPHNILTDYLSSKPDDSEAEARFKNAVESGFTGLAMTGIFMGARALRAARSVDGAVQDENTFLKTKYGSVSDEDLSKTVGDPKLPAIEIKPSDAEAKIAQGAADTENLAPRSVIRSRVRPAPVAEGETPVPTGPQSKDFSVYVNFSKFTEPDQVKFAIGKMAEAAQGTIDEARRGVITQQETQKLADDLGMSVEDLLNRQKGQPFNAEQAVAARQLWAASAERLLETAKIAAGPNAGPLDQFAFRQMMAVHSAIQSEVIGARTETARALASWNIPVSGGIERARAIDQVMQAYGGSDVSQEMARRLAILGDTGATPAAIGNLAAKGFGAVTTDAIKEAFVNGLLSNPKTHIVNMFSNTLVAAAAVAERQVAGTIRAVTGGDGVQMGEAAAMTYGLVSSVRDAFRYAAKSLQTGESAWNFQKYDVAAHNAISADAFSMSKDTGLGRFVDFLGNAARIPSHLMSAEDEWFKTIGYRMELHAQALRQGISEGLNGEALGQRMAEIIQNPPEAIRINSADAALYNTFTNSVGWFGNLMMKLRSSGGALNPSMFVIPFVRTPVNIARYAFERTPLAPLVGQWRADIAAGGARADLALARMSTGTAIMLATMDMADKGKITGPSPGGQGKDATVREALQREGVPPNSFQVGNKWVSYDRADPFGMVMGFAASIAESVKKGELDQDQVDEWQEVTAMAIAAVSQVAINKTYLQGMARLIGVMNDHTPGKTQTYVDNLVASFLPGTSAMAGIKGLVDPIQREVNGPRDAVEARIAGLSSKLTPRRDLWGTPMDNSSGLGRVYDYFTPMAVKSQEPTPVDREIVRLGGGPERIQKQTPFDGVQANMRFYPQVYDDYTRLAGNDLKSAAHGGLGAKDYLNAVVSGNHPMSAVYNMMSDDSRKSFINSTVNDYRKEAQQQILGDPKNGAFAAEIARLKEIQMQSRMPMLGGPK